MGLPADRRVLRFGPFELDGRAGELRKRDIKIKLREQPIKILAMLLENPGEVVLRDEIRLRLWPNNTIVEFDHGINAAIQKLRDALGDSASEPRYVETVARRGYRFLGEVEKVGEPEPADPPSEIDQSHLEGTTISHYRILEKLGEGGMGVVWRAHDPRRNRDVAIKVSAERFSDRFEREALAIAALDHPNICTLYDVGHNYLVMELIEGDSPKGPLPLHDALRIAHQIADALDAAHEKGIVHRDLKPGNIKIKPDGNVKVLDFGLAKTIEAPSGDPEDSPTVTVAGMIIGYRSLHVARTGSRQNSGQASRHLGLRRRALRIANRPPSISRQRSAGDAGVGDEGSARPEHRSHPSASTTRKMPGEGPQSTPPRHRRCVASGAGVCPAVAARTAQVRLERGGRSGGRSGNDFFSVPPRKKRPLPMLCRIWLSASFRPPG